MAILGIDEVGRGPLAGPLVVGACVFKQPVKDLTKAEAPLEGLTDSKKLTAKKREKLSQVIPQFADYALAWVSAEMLDTIGLSGALSFATRRAVRQINTPFDEIISDGTVNFLKGTDLEGYVTTLKKADLLISEVSAASIMAKVARDNYMTKIAQYYPEYAFDKHVGYGTKAHMLALNKFGPCPEHRYSFRPVAEAAPSNAKEIISVRQKKNTTSIGKQAETKVAGYLIERGHRIIAHNWKTSFCEIDLVSIKDNNIYFTEVKYRKNISYGDGFQAITADKKKRMSFAAKTFLAAHKYQYQELSPLLAVASVTGSDFDQLDFLVLDQ